jgi:hypothetical protein
MRRPFRRSRYHFRIPNVARTPSNKVFGVDRVNFGVGKLYSAFGICIAHLSLIRRCGWLFLRVRRGHPRMVFLCETFMAAGPSVRGVFAVLLAYWSRIERSKIANGRPNMPGSPMRRSMAIRSRSIIFAISSTEPRPTSRRAITRNLRSRQARIGGYHRFVLGRRYHRPYHREFGFAGMGFLAVSIETRRELDESYSSIAGFFKQ